MTNQTRLVMGPILILMGIILLLGHLGIGSLANLWPMILLVLGGGMIWRYQRGRKESGMIFVGVLTLLLGLRFLAGSWSWMPFPREWPFFLLAVGVSFFAMGIVDRERKAAFIPGAILVGLALIFYLEIWGFFHFLFKLIGWLFRLLAPLALIAAGAWLIFRRGHASDHQGWMMPEKLEPDEEAEASSAGPPPDVPLEEEAEAVAEADFDEIPDDEKDPEKE